MKRILLCFCLCFTGFLFLWSLNINQVEYYLDTDPGLGLATQVPVTPAADINTGFEVNLQDASAGLHILYIRAKDESGKWSLLNSKFILKQSTLNTPVTYLEYFFDTDPGYHNGTSLSFSGSSDILCSESLPLSQLTTGLHFLYVRCCDAEGSWSQNYCKMLYKIAPDINPITYAEMFFDHDPGQGFGIPLSYRTMSKDTYELNFNISAADVNPGMHLFCVRVKDSAGFWSLNATKFIYLNSNEQSEICRVQWYFTGSDADPDEIFTYELTNPAEDITLAMEASIVHLHQDGEYQLHIYCVNTRGQISMFECKTFTADFSPNNVVLQIDGSTVTLNWDGIIGADRYLVTVKNDPAQTGGTVYTVSDETISLPAGQKGFFTVQAQRDARNNVPALKTSGK
ncbi:MAG TPA: hypothetical protein PLF50_07790 [Candidatus Cloacimonadota bacterium]|nr:hypothetical protein [Candidatus Cloacimonadota bacterium]